MLQISTERMLPRIRPGEVITAEFLNTLAAAIERSLRGVEAEAGGVAAVLAALRRDELVQARLKRVRFLGDPGPTGQGTTMPSLPSEISYDAVAVGRPGIALSGATPIYGRPVRNDEIRIYPALVGMVCYIVRSPRNDGTGQRGELMLLPGSEVQAFRPCPAGGAGAVRAGGRAIPPEELPLLPPLDPSTPLTGGILQQGPDGLLGPTGGESDGASSTSPGEGGPPGSAF